MKQNERLLVYAVTGFLALILMVAVIFGRDPSSGSTGLSSGDGGSKVGSGKSAQSLLELLGDGVGAGANGTAQPEPGQAGKGTSNSGLPAPAGIATEQPLVAASKAQLAADLVAQALGSSRRVREVRFVRARSGDSLELLVRRWCGARDPYFAEAQSLNEDLVVLRAGQEVGLPWVDDEVLLAALEAQQPKLLVATDGGAGGLPREAAVGPGGDVPGRVLPGSGLPGSGLPGSDLPGSGSAVEAAARLGAERAPVAARSYVVQPGDSLWRIAERSYGRLQADRMVRAMRAANPGLTDALRPGQTIVLPPADGAGS